jgi:hypothetical protein
MNHLQKKKENQRLRNLINPSYPEGCVKIVGNVSHEHEVTKAAVFHYLKKEGYDVWSEVNLNGGGRADIVAIKGQFGYIVEILCSESEKRYNAKFDYYPEEFTMVRVSTESFNVDTFKL